MAAICISEMFTLPVYNVPKYKDPAAELAISGILISLYTLILWLPAGKNHVPQILSMVKS